MAFESKPQDEQVEKIEEKIEKSETEKAIDLVGESETEIKKNAAGKVASKMVEIEKANDNSLSNDAKQTTEPLSKQIDFMQTYQGKAIENYRQIVESYIDFQKKMLDAWTPYFRNVSKKVYDTFMSPDVISDSYYKYLTGISNLTKAWNSYFSL
jgi:hypothetical protein